MHRMLSALTVFGLLATPVVGQTQPRDDVDRAQGDAREVNYAAESSGDLSAATRSREYVRQARQLARGSESNGSAATDQESGNAPLQVDDDVILPAQDDSGPDGN